MRGLFTGPLSFLVYGASLLIGGIVLLAFYESPLSPLPVPPLPHPPVGRFPPEHPVWPVNRLHRASSGPTAASAQNFPQLNFPHPAQFIRNPTQYQFVSSASHPQPLMVEKPAFYQHAHNHQQQQPASVAQRRASNVPSTSQHSKTSASQLKYPQFQPLVQPSTAPAFNHQGQPKPLAGIAAENSFDKRSSSTGSEVKPTESQMSVSPAVSPTDNSKASHKLVVSGHKPSSPVLTNSPLSNVNLLNVVNGNNLMRRDEDSAESKQQQLVQAQLNQVQFSSSQL